VVLTAACGGNSDNSSNGGGQQPNGYGGGNNAFAAYIQCLNQNGVTITMPSGGVRNRPSDGASRGPGAFPSGQPRPSGSAGLGGGPGGARGGGMFQKPDGVDDATWQKAQTACASLRPSGGPGRGGNGGNGMNAAFQNCLKDHGVTDTGQLNTADATVQKAVEACKVLQPQASATPTA
jgi:hypothetical protein